MIALSPSLLIAGASALVGVAEDRPEGRGRTVEAILRGVGLPTDAPWDAALVHHAGYWSHYDDHTGYSAWPLPRSGHVADLARVATEARVLSTEEPRGGELFLLCDQQGDRFMRAGIIVYSAGVVSRKDGVPGFRCRTIEGNTTDCGMFGGPGVHRLWRVVCPTAGDRFIRWVELDRRKVA